MFVLLNLVIQKTSSCNIMRQEDFEGPWTWQFWLTLYRGSSMSLLHWVWLWLVQSIHMLLSKAKIINSLMQEGLMSFQKGQHAAMIAGTRVTQGIGIPYSLSFLLSWATTTVYSCRDHTVFADIKRLDITTQSQQSCESQCCAGKRLGFWRVAFHRKAPAVPIESWIVRLDQWPCKCSTQRQHCVLSVCRSAEGFSPPARSSSLSGTC